MHFGERNGGPGEALRLKEAKAAIELFLERFQDGLYGHEELRTREQELETTLRALGIPKKELGGLKRAPSKDLRMTPYIEALNTAIGNIERQR